MASSDEGSGEHGRRRLFFVRRLFKPRVRGEHPVNEPRVEFSSEEIRLLDDAPEEGKIGLNPKHPVFLERPAKAGNRFAAALGPNDQL